MSAPEDFRDRVRDAVLASLDEVAAELKVPGKSPGALDKDLPDLFRALDAHADKLWQRIVNQTDERYREEAQAIMDGRACLVRTSPAAFDKMRRPS